MKKLSVQLYGLLWVLLSLVGMALLLTVPRSHMAELMVLYCCMLTLQLFVLYHIRRHPRWHQYVFPMSVLLHVVACFFMPRLSDDCYRFVWDGILTLRGVNPYSITPDAYLSLHPGDSVLASLFPLLNSPHYHSVYPPVLQGLFAGAVYAAGSGTEPAVYLLKTANAAGSLVAVAVLLQWLKDRPHAPWWCAIFALHPAVIAETGGNLHFEGLMLGCMAGAFWLMHRQRYVAAGVFFALAVHVKLIPLLALPLWWAYMRGAGRSQFAWGFMAGVAVPLIPVVLWPGSAGITGGLSLYFRTFEFNSGIYALVREAGNAIVGYNLIAVAGPALAALAGVAALMMAWRVYRIPFPPVNILATFTGLTFAVYYLLSTTVHPWYLLPAAFWMSFSGRFTFPAVWLSAGFLSYHAYAMPPAVIENGWITALEYSLVAAALLYDVKGFIVKQNINCI